MKFEKSKNLNATYFMIRERKFDISLREILF